LLGRRRAKNVRSAGYSRSNVNAPRSLSSMSGGYVIEQGARQSRDHEDEDVPFVFVTGACVLMAVFPP